MEILNKFFLNIAKNLKAALSGLREFLATKIPLKIMKNIFYFTLKALFFLKIFNFLSSLFGHVEKQFDKNDKFYFKFMTSQPGK